MKFYAPKYKQLDLGLLRSSLDELDKTNRWVALGDLLPWTELEKEYNSRLYNQKKGAGNKPARMILGAMIIKHKLNLSDAETIEIIRESPYMQYFCGLHEFTDKPIFDPSLFVTIRKRISEEELNKMTVKLLNKQRRLLEEKRKREEEEAKKNDEEPPTPEPEEPNAASFTDSKGREHKGVLKIDATCADAEMRYPVDVDIIHDGCRKVTDYIQDWWPYEPNWAFLMTQLKAIMDEYELSYIDVLLILKYCREYEQIELDPTYGLYQFFPKYIEPTRKFIEDIDNAKDEAKDLFNPTPILAKKYRPKRKFKFDLTFD